MSINSIRQYFYLLLNLSFHAEIRIDDSISMSYSEQKIFENFRYFGYLLLPPEKSQNTSSDWEIFVVRLDYPANSACSHD
jgi:hypothetical protein